jgi:hypothetical protein
MPSAAGHFIRNPAKKISGWPQLRLPSLTPTEFFLTRPDRFWEPNHAPIQRVPGLFPSRVKRLGREADQSPPSSAEVKKCVELYLHTPIHLHGRYREIVLIGGIWNQETKGNVWPSTKLKSNVF